MGKNRKLLIFVSVIIIFSIGVILSFIDSTPYKGNIPADIYIYKGTNKKNVIRELESTDSLGSSFTIKVLMSFSKCRKISSGHYVINKNMTNNDIRKMFCRGLQTPVKITFNNIRTINQLAGNLAGQLMEDSVSLLKGLTDSVALDSLHINYRELPFLFIPDTYETWWNISPETLMRMFIRENKRFWNNQRLKKAAAIKLSSLEVSVLASIVDEETKKEEEMPRVAGVYLNRIKWKMPLQSDPTVKYAIGDFSIRRILTKYLKFDSPYNTYKYKGLPPGPIRIASVKAIDAVLNAEKHHYLYMCAKSDFSGSHVFARTLRQHNINAMEYHRALDKLRILH